MNKIDLDPFIKKLFEKSSDLFLMVDPCAHLLHLNRTAQKILLQNLKGDAEKKSVLDYLNVKQQKELLEQLKQSKAGLNDSLVLNLIREGEAELEVEFDLHPNPLDPSSSTYFMLGKVLVNTFSLEFNNEEINRIFHKTQALGKIGGWELDVATGETQWTEGVYHIYGLSSETPTNKIQGISYYAPHERDRISACVERCITEALGYDEIFEFIDDQGMFKWVRVIGQPIVGEGGKVSKVVGTFQDVTEMKSLQNERELSHLISAQKLAQIGSWQFDVSSQQITWSRQMFEIFPEDYQKGAPSFERHRSTIHPQDVASWESTVQKCISDGEPYRLIFRTFREEDPNEVVYVEALGEALKDTRGEVIQLRGTCQDISKREKSRLKNLELQNKLKEVLDFAPVGLFETDSQGRCLYVNRAWSEITGLSLEEALGDNWSQTLHPEDRDKVFKAWSEAIKSGENFDFSYRFINQKNNKTYHVHGKSCELRNQNGEIRGYLGAIIDQTQIKEKEQALIETKSIMHNLLDAIPHVIWYKDHEQKIVFVNQRYSDFFDKPKDYFVGKTDREIFPGEQGEEFYQYERELYHSKELRIKETKLSVEGQLKIYLGHFFPVKDNRSAILGTGGILEDVTDERQRALELDNFFNRSLDLLCIAGLDGHFKKINPAFEKLLGKSQEEILRTPLIDFIHPDDRAKTIAEIEKIGHGEVTINFKNRYLAFDGSYHDLNWVACYDRDFALIYAAAHDVTALINLNRNIEAYKKGLDEYAIVARTTKEGVITEVNDNFCAISGYAREELIGKTHSMVSSGFHPQSFWRDLWQTILSGQVWKGEVCNRSKEGETYWVDTTIIPILDPRGEIMEFLAFRYDITNEKRVAQEVDDQKNFLSDTINNLPAIFYAKDTNGRFLLVNKAFVDFYGSTEEEIVGKDNFELFDEETAALFWENDQKVLLDKSYLEFEENARDKLGALRSYHTFKFPYRDKNGEAYAMGGVSLDITEKKQFERQAYHNSRLLTMGELAAGIGHEINNPLTIIKGFISSTKKNVLLHDHPHQKKILEYLAKMDTATDRIAGIVRGLRNFSRSEVTENQLFDLNQAIKETYHLLEEVYRHEGIELVVNLSVDEEIFIEGNRGKFQQIIMNLISNAKDALVESSQKRIEIRLEQDQRRVHLLIMDTGKGIPEDVLERVFDPFFTTKEVNQGTGIGLSLTHKFVQELRGQISINSQLNQGTQVRLVFPISQGDKGSSEVPVLKSQAEPHQDKKWCKILIAEDEEDIRSLLVDLLKGIDAEVEAVGDGQLAWEALKRAPHAFDLLISDIKMPIIDGVELLEKIREDDSINKDLKFIFITGGVNIDLADNKEIGQKIDGYLYKPFSEEDVINLVHSCLNYPIKKQSA